MKKKRLFKKFNFELINSIVGADFFLLENKNFKHIRTISLISNVRLFVLDVIELNFCIKQLIRLLQFTKKKELKINVVNYKHPQVNILKWIFIKKRKLLENNFFFSTLFSDLKSNLKHPELFITISSKVDVKKNSLLYDINSEITKIDSGGYRMLNDLKSLNKLLFFSSILYTVLSIHKNKP